MTKIINYIKTHKASLGIFSSRILSEGFILWKVYQETGAWMLVFGICVTIAIELQWIWNTIQNKTNDAIVELIAKKDIDRFLDKNHDNF